MASITPAAMEMVAAPELLIAAAAAAHANTSASAPA